MSQFWENLWIDRKMDGQTIGKTEMERQTLFHRNPLFWLCASGQQEEKPQKKSQIKHCLTIKHCKSYWLEIGMMQQEQDVSYVRSLKFVKSGLSFLKLMIMIEHIRMMQKPYLDIWSMLLLTSASMGYSGKNPNRGGGEVEDIEFPGVLKK